MTTNRTALTTLLTIALLGACSTSQQPAGSETNWTRTCSLSQPCGANERCVAGVCIAVDAGVATGATSSSTGGGDANMSSTGSPPPGTSATTTGANSTIGSSGTASASGTGASTVTSTGTGTGTTASVGATGGGSSSDGTTNGGTTGAGTTGITGSSTGLDAGLSASSGGSDGGARDLRPLSFQPGIEYALSVGGVQQIALGDLDGDGMPDIAGTRDAGGIAVIRNLGDGSFDMPTRYDASAASSPVSNNAIAIGDLDGDGKVDVVANPANVWMNLGQGTLAAAIGWQLGGGTEHPSSAAIGDMNGDGNVDFIVVGSIWLNDGKGVFGAHINAFRNDSVKTSPTSFAIGDLDGDGVLDLAATTTSASANVAVFLNHGDATFAPAISYAGAANAYSVAIADLNGDGKADLATANYGVSGSVSVRINQGNGTFGPATDYTVGAAPWALVAADLNHDGSRDLAVALYQGAGNNVNVLLNQGDGTFAAPVALAAGAYPQSIVASDLDGNGRIDLAVGNHDSGTVTVLLNTSR